MKYNQPYGISDPDAAYINGDPSISRAGSIPPAASIEFPQREIVNLITDTGLIIPANTDLHQLAKAVQTGQLNYKPDTGLANFYAATLIPNPGTYFDGLTVVLKIKNTNTGPAVLNLNGIGNAPVVRSDGTDVSAGDLRQGAMACFVFDSTRAQFQIVWAASVAIGPPGPPGPPGEPGQEGQGGGGWTWLKAPLHLYVNGATGNDSYDGTVAVYTDGTHGPFKTLQRASDETRKYNLNNYGITVHIAGPYTYARFIGWTANGAGAILWQGDTVNTPPNVVVATDGVGGTAIIGGGGAQYDGLRIRAAVPGLDTNGWPGWGIYSGGPSTILYRIWFDDCTGGMIAASEVFCGIIGPIYVNGSGPYFASTDGGRVGLNSAVHPLISFSGVCNFSNAFYLGNNLGRFAGIWGTMTNAGIVTGKKFHIQGNSIVDVWGSGINYLPGNLPGTLLYGGQYY